MFLFKKINSKYCGYFNSFQDAYYLSRTSARCHQKEQDVFKHLAQKLTQLVSLFFCAYQSKNINIKSLEITKNLSIRFFYLTTQPILPHQILKLPLSL
jgi:hypothetical protein